MSKPTSRLATVLQVIIDVIIYIAGKCMLLFWLWDKEMQKCVMEYTVNGRGKILIIFVCIRASPIFVLWKNCTCISIKNTDFK